jgi:asparagine synthase (glutamine-hydrolysing)
MCGIAGLVYKNSGAFDVALLSRMAGIIEHRGPDGEGFFVDKESRVGLANRRLSIIDIEGGAQPMSNGDESVWITYNGEIYNFRELRKELEQVGHHFKTRSDTEVILRAYEEFGVAAFEKLNGIFGFAIYDKHLSKVFLVRDRFGVKPAYYFEGDDKSLFGSEIRSILADESVKRKLNADALNEFLAFRYNPSPNTLFAGLRKLAPGHYLEITPNGCSDQLNYLSTKLPSIADIDEGEAISEYRWLLRGAVQRQMVSDVPIGLFLSGGVDSAAIGKLMSEASGQPIRTFSVGFPGKGDHNELADARDTARLLGSEHAEITIDAREYLEFFVRSFDVIEEPIAETSVSALYYLSRRAAQDVKVVLAGQGADEPMGGYQRYLGISLIEKYGALVRAASPLASIVPRAGRFKQAAEVAKYSTDIDRLIAAYSIFTPDQRAALLRTNSVNGSVCPERLIHLLQHSSTLPDLLSKTMYIDTRLSLADDLLLFNDKVTMANSLEMRVPFLDHELIAFIETLPANLKVRGTTRKYIHKKAVEALLPREIVHRKKRGFQTPMDEWLQRDLATVSLDLFEEQTSAARRYFDLNYVKRLVDEHSRRRHDHQKRLYALLCFELWHRTWIDQTPIDPEKLLSGASAL